MALINISDGPVLMSRADRDKAVIQRTLLATDSDDGSGTSVSPPDTPAQPPATKIDANGMAVSGDSRGIMLRSMHLTKKNNVPHYFDKHKLFFVGVCFDYSGLEQYDVPAKGAMPNQVLMQVKGVDTYEYQGDGMILFPKRIVTGAINMRLSLFEFEGDLAAFGQKLAAYAGAAQGSGLSYALKAIPEGGQTIGTVMDAATAAVQGMGMSLGGAQDKSIDLFGGSFRADRPWYPGLQRFTGDNSSIELEFI
jgi:hypothetical protein